MADGAILELLNAGGDAGLLMFGVYLLRLSNRVSRLETINELKERQRRG